MPEPVSVGIGMLTWEYVVKPVADSIKKEYGEETKNLLKRGLSKVSEKLPFGRNDNEAIECEIIEAIESKEIIDEKSMIEFLEKNSIFLSALSQLQDSQSGTEIINSLKDISSSEISVKGENKKISDSFEGISDSKIDI